MQGRWFRYTGGGRLARRTLLMVEGVVVVQTPTHGPTPLSSNPGRVHLPGSTRRRAGGGGEAPGRGWDWRPPPVAARGRARRRGLGCGLGPARRRPCKRWSARCCRKPRLATSRMREDGRDSTARPGASAHAHQVRADSAAGGGQGRARAPSSERRRSQARATCNQAVRRAPPRSNSCNEAVRRAPPRSNSCNRSPAAGFGIRSDFSRLARIA